MESRQCKFSSSFDYRFVTAKASGLLKVIAMYYAGQNISDTFTIVITNHIPYKDLIAIASIGVNSDNEVSTITSYRGGLQFNVIFYPEAATKDSIIWSVDNTDRAKISGTGILTAIGNGQVKVIAHCFNNEVMLDSFFVEISNQIESISINSPGDMLEISVFGGTLQLTTTALLQGVDESVTWKSNDVSNATVDGNGLVTAVSDGKVTISATSKLTYRVSDEITLIISNREEIIDDVLSNAANSFVVYPNPIQNEFFIQNGNQINRVEVLSLDGSVQISEIDNGLKSLNIDATNLSSGIYILILHTEQGIISQRIVK